MNSIVIPLRNPLYLPMSSTIVESKSRLLDFCKRLSPSQKDANIIGMIFGTPSLTGASQDARRHLSAIAKEDADDIEATLEKLSLLVI